MEAATKPLVGAMLVYVRSYIRIRFGNTEWVTTHFRRWPRT